MKRGIGVPDVFIDRFQCTVNLKDVYKEIKRIKKHYKRAPFTVDDDGNLIWRDENKKEPTFCNFFIVPTHKLFQKIRMIISSCAVWLSIYTRRLIA